MPNITIDFGEIEGPIYTGRPRGEALRTKFALDKLDIEHAEVKIIIPEKTYSISSSFFLGLFGDSVVSAGSREVFYSHFKFTTNDMFAKIIDGYVQRALDEKGLMT